MFLIVNNFPTAQNIKMFALGFGKFSAYGNKRHVNVLRSHKTFKHVLQMNTFDNFGVSSPISATIVS